jgi:hypothetical protein
VHKNWNVALSENRNSLIYKYLHHGATFHLLPPEEPRRYFPFKGRMRMFRNATGPWSPWNIKSILP